MYHYFKGTEAIIDRPLIQGKNSPNLSRNESNRSAWNSLYSKKTKYTNKRENTTKQNDVIIKVQKQQINERRRYYGNNTMTTNVDI